jgi:hypothetical protein
MTKRYLVHYYIRSYDHRFTKRIVANSFSEANALAHELEPLCRVERIDEENQEN